jgi:hypothetical protein
LRRGGRHPKLVGTLGKWICRFTACDCRRSAGGQAKQLVGRHGCQLAFDVLRYRRLEVTRHARNHYAGSSGLYQVAEYFQSQCDAQKIHCEYHFR